MKNVVTPVILFLITCAPVPWIQSSKINTSPSLACSLISPEGASNFPAKDVLATFKKYKGHFGYFLPAMNRFEFGGFIVPFYYLNWWDINIKYHVAAIGNDNVLFHNFSSSCFVHSNGYSNIAGSVGPALYGGGGLIFETSGSVCSNTIKFVYMPSVNYHSYQESYGEGDTTVDIQYIRKTFDSQLGVIFSPVFLENYEFLLSVTYSHPFSEVISGEYQQYVHFNRIIIQAGIIKNIPSRRFSKKHN